MVKVSDYIIKYLEKYRVKDIFMLTGGGCMHLVDSAGKSRKIKITCCHHEQACAMAAEAYGKLAGELAVTIVTAGPGATNAITGVVGAFQDSVPCLFMSGQSKRQQTIHNSGVKGLRQMGVQEVDIIPIIDSVTKYSVMVNEPEKIRYYLEKAVFVATHGRPGPVWLDIPLDVQATIIDESKLLGFDPKELVNNTEIKPARSDLNKVVSYLKKAKRPVIIAGQGVRLAKATKELATLVSRNNLPVVTPIMGIDVLETDHPNYVGRIGTKGTRAGNFAMQNADLILSIGSRLSISSVGHEYKTFARAAKIVVVDIDPQEHQKKTIKIDHFIQADAKLFMKELATKLGGQKTAESSQWLAKCSAWKKRYPVNLPEYAKVRKPVNTYYFIDVLNQLLPASVPIISDAGSSFYIVSQAINVKKNQRYITSGALATMGFGLPAVIGVSRALGDQPVVTITGDGSFQQNIQELQTIIQYKLPVKIFVINNGGYLSIRMTQKKYFASNFVGESRESGVSFPSTAKIAAAYGIKFFQIKKSSEVKKIVAKVLAYKGPVICDIETLRDQEVIPTNLAALREDGVMISKPLEDMYPFLSREEFLENMIIEPVKE